MYFAFFKNVYSASSWNHFFKGTSANHKVAISPLQGVSELAAQGHKPDERGLPNQSESARGAPANFRPSDSA